VFIMLIMVASPSGLLGLLHRANGWRAIEGTR
jgi:hypothetical protein